MIDRSSLKVRAVELCKTSSPSLLLVGLIYALLAIIISTLSSRVMSAGITISDANRFLNAFYSGISCFSLCPLLPGSVYQ